MLTIVVLFYFLIERLINKQIYPKDFNELGTALAFTILISCLFINFGRIWYWKEHKKSNINWLINRHDNYSQTDEGVTNHPKNFLHFRIFDYLETPFPEFRGTKESHYFWNLFFKTILYDESLNYIGNKNLPRLINVAFLVCLSCLVWMIYSMRATTLYHISMRAIILMAIFSIAMLISARISVPVSYQGSARYIYM